MELLLVAAAVAFFAARGGGGEPVPRLDAAPPPPPPNGGFRGYLPGGDVLLPPTEPGRPRRIDHHPNLTPPRFTDLGRVAGELDARDVAPWLVAAGTAAGSALGAGPAAKPAAGAIASVVADPVAGLVSDILGLGNGANMSPQQLAWVNAAGPVGSPAWNERLALAQGRDGSKQLYTPEEGGDGYSRVGGIYGRPELAEPENEQQPVFDAMTGEPVPAPPAGLSFKLQRLWYQPGTDREALLRQAGLSPALAPPALEQDAGEPPALFAAPPIPVPRQRGSVYTSEEDT